MLAFWMAVFFVGFGLAPLQAGERLRVATYTAELDRKGPGLLLRDILTGKDPQIPAVAQIIAKVAPDVILLTRFDYDLGGVALAAFADVVAEHGTSYPFQFALRPNSGVATGLDMDGDGRRGGPRDAQGYGWFAGQNGLAILSKYPINVDGARDFSGFLWRDLPGAVLPEVLGAPFPSPEAQAVQRLSTTAHWDVPVVLPGGGQLHLLAFHATPPVFDGAEDRNGLRNRDELRFWTEYLNGTLTWPPPTAPFVVLGNANLDPTTGDGLRDAMAAFLTDPRLHDPKPASKGAASGGFRRADVAQYDTAAWDAEGEPGNMRVDYVLPSAALGVSASGVFWPAAGDGDVDLLGEDGRGASRHRLVWVDIFVP